MADEDQTQEQPETAEASPRNVKAIFIDPNDLITLLVENAAFRVFRGIPAGAACIGVHFSPMHKLFCLYFTHPSFDYVPIGAVIPQLDVQTVPIPIEMLDQPGGEDRTVLEIARR